MVTPLFISFWSIIAILNKWTKYAMYRENSRGFQRGNSRKSKRNQRKFKKKVKKHICLGIYNSRLKPKISTKTITEHHLIVAYCM